MRGLSGVARGLLERRRIGADLAWRRPPRLRVHPARGGHDPAVYYLVPHLSEPAGGVRVMYRHVDLLNEMGVSAAVLHDRAGFRAGWFANETRIVYPGGLRLYDNDILVLAEVYAPGFGLLPPDVRKLIFNQAAYHTYDRLPIGTDPYTNLPGLLGIMAVSQDNAELLRFSFPGIDVFRTRPMIDAKLFHRTAQPSRRRLAFTLDRRHEERAHLLQLLAARGVDWEQVPISGRSEVEVGQIMRDCAIFLAFSERDGFGLPPAEAMACGSFVIGYDGGGGREFFDPAYSRPVTDQRGFAQAVIDAVARPLEELQALGVKASEQVLATYTLDGLRSDLDEVYGRLL